MQFALFTFAFSCAYSSPQGSLQCNDSDLSLNLKDGRSCYFYDFNRDSFLKAKRKDLFCEGSFCMKKEKLIRAKKGSNNYIYRKVQNQLMISQCAPSLGVKVVINLVSSYINLRLNTISSKDFSIFVERCHQPWKNPSNA